MSSLLQPHEPRVLADRDLLERAQHSPLNETEEGPAWPGLLDKVLAPSRRAKL